MFYLLSLVTGILECGWIAYGVSASFPLWQILCYPLSYHLGNLFPKPFSISRKYLTVMSAISFIIHIYISTNNPSENVTFVLTCISIFMLSAIIQSVRSNIKSDGNRLAKRIFRVVGFALSPLTAVMPSFIMLFISIISFYCLKDYKEKCGIFIMKPQRGFSTVMLFHQLHYFFYAHITLSTVSLMFTNSFPDAGIFMAALIFCGTWITYMSVEPIVSKLTASILPVFYIGHIAVSILLTLMCFTESNVLFTILWLVTGLGGGVVYTISAQAKTSGSYDKTSMTIAENIGHTAGLVAVVLISANFSVNSQDIMLMSGAASALLAVITMFLLSRKEHLYETICNKS